MRTRGAPIVALDVPSGVNASTGETDGVAIPADLTVTFASVKRGHVVNRGLCGIVVVVDIGIQGETVDHSIPLLVDEHWVGLQVPAILATAHKGTRKKVAIVGGATGMAGACILTARAAQRSGAGMVKLVVAPDSLPIVQETEPYALATLWPTSAFAIDEEIVKWADVVIVGPGLGRGTPAATCSIWCSRGGEDERCSTPTHSHYSRGAPPISPRPSADDRPLTPHPWSLRGS
jgi:NAD(P)H-hydrate epimerase